MSVAPTPEKFEPPLQIRGSTSAPCPRWIKYFSLVAGCVFLFVVGGQAQTFQFSGSSDPDTGALWGSGTNWVGGRIPGSGAAVKIELLGTLDGPQVALDTGAGVFSVGQISVAAPQPEAGSFVILSSDTGSSLSLVRLDAGSGTTLELFNTVNLIAPTAGLEINKDGGGTVSLGSVSGGKLIVSGGTVALLGGNSYSGGTLLKAGKLEIGGSADAADLGTGTVAVSGGVLNLKSSVSVSELMLNGGEVRSDPDASGVALTVTGSIRATSGVLAVDVNGNADSSTQLLKSGQGTLVVSGLNAYGDFGSIGTVINAGTLVVTQNSALGSGGIELKGGVLKSDSGDEALLTVLQNALNITGVAALNGGVGGLELPGQVDLGGGRRSIAVENLVNMSGVISDGSSAATLVKTGAGKLMLTAANTYSGGTELRSGVLELSGGGDFGTGGVEVDGGELQILKQISISQFTLNGGAVSGTGELAVGGTINIRAGNISVSLAGNAGLNKTGPGEAVLRGANTYSGDTTLNGGVVMVGNDSALGSGRILLHGGTLKGDVSGQSRHLVNNLTLQSDSGLSGGVGGLEIGGDVDLGAGRYALSVEGKVLVSGGLQNGGLTKKGKGTLTITAQNNVYSGGIAIEEGTLEALSADGLALGSGLVAVRGGVLSTGAGAGVPLAVNGIDIASGAIRGERDVAVTGTIYASGGGSATVDVALLNGSSGVTNLVKTGSGTLFLNRSNTYRGTTEINAGVVAISTSEALGNGLVTLNGGGIKASGAQTFSNNLIVLGKAAFDGGQAGLISTGAIDLSGENRALDISGNVTISGIISNGALTKDGTGSLTLAGINQYLGGTIINAGTLFALNEDSLGGGKVVIAGGILYSDVALKVASISFQGGAMKGVGKLNVTGVLAVTSGSLESVISGTAGVSKTGSGILEITGQNDYSGDTQINEGTVLISGNSALGSSAVKINGATLASRGTVSLGVANSISVEGAATLGGSLGKLTVQGATNLAQNSSLAVEGEVELGGKVTGSLQKSGAGNLTLAAANPDLGSVAVASGTVSATVAGALGSQAIVVGGSGKVDLTKMASYTFSALPGNASSSREITVNGELSGALVVFDSGTTLKGSGTVNAGVLLSNSILAPGNSPGTITIGTINTAGAASYHWQRENTGTAARPTVSSKYDRVIVSNGAGSNLASLEFKPLNSTTGLPIPVVGPNPLIPREDSFAYDQVKGFDRYVGVIQGSLAASGRPHFEAHTAVIKVSLVPSNTGLPGAAPGVDLYVERTSYAKFAEHPNDAAFGAYLTASLKEHYDKDNDSIGVLMRQLDSAIDGSVIATALNAYSPGTAYGSIATVNLRRAQALGASLDGRLDELAAAGASDSVFNFGATMRQNKAVLPAMLTPGQQEEDKQWAAWTAGYTNRSTLEADLAQGFGRTTSNDSGASLGLERSFGNLRVGLLASFGQSESNTEDSPTHLSGDHWTTGAYGTVAIGSVILDASALWGRGEEKTRRSSAHAAFDTQSTQLGLGIAFNLLPQSSGWQITPVARIKFLGYSQEGFEEAGSGLLFKTDKVTESTSLSKLGLRIGHRSDISKNITLGLDGAAYWVHDFNASGKPVTMHLAGTSGSFQAVGRKSSSETAQLNMGIQSTFSESLTIRLSGQQDLGGARSQSAGVFSIAVNF